MDAQNTKPVSYALLNELWAYCRDVFFAIDAIDMGHLNDADRVELDHITRITSGYAIVLLEVQGMPDSQRPTNEQFREMRELIHSHCSRAYAALNDTIAEQNGTKRTRRIAL